MDIIQYLLNIIQYLYEINRNLIYFICKYIPLKQMIHDDSKSPKYQKLKVDELPIIKQRMKQNWRFLLLYYKWRYHKNIKPVSRKGPPIPKGTVCPICGAPEDYIYDNNKRGQYRCKICDAKFSKKHDPTTKIQLVCPYCGKALVAVKDRKFFRIHKCVNPKCSYYLKNLKNVDKDDLENDKYKYKLHYIYREFTVDFFEMDLDSLPAYASSLKFRKQDAQIMSLCLTYHVNLGLSLRKTADAMQYLYNVNISHTQVANYCKTAAVVIKPFVDHYDYQKSNIQIADETYIKVKGVKSYVWFIIDAVSRSVLGYQVSDTRSVGPCIKAMRMAFRGFKQLPNNFKFIADGYSVYQLAAMQFFREFGDKFKFAITQVIGLTNDDSVSTEYRPYKQMIERMNRTFKITYRPTYGYENLDGAAYSLTLWVAYYNFLRPHQSFHYHVLNKVPELNNIETMPGKWQMLIYLGQQEILKMQQNQTC